MRTPVPTAKWLVAVVVASALFGPLGLTACEKDKPPATTAGSASTTAATVAASSAAPPDPKELKYVKLRKELKDRNLAYLTSLQKIYGGTGKDEETSFKALFPKTPEGQKEADEIFKEAAFTGKEGMAIASFEIVDLSFDEKLENSTADISEKQMQRGKPRCVIYKLRWKDQGGTFYRTAKTDMNVVPCP